MAAARDSRMRMMREAKVRDGRFTRCLEDHFFDFSDHVRTNVYVNGVTLIHALLALLWPDPAVEAPKRMYSPNIEDLRDDYAVGDIPEAVLRVTDGERQVPFGEI